MAESSLEWADRFCDFYASKGLLRGEEALPLHCDCPAAPDCWEGESAYPPRHEASISIPWCGPDYRSGGVAVVAINMNKYGGLGAHWWIRLERIRELRRGRHRAFDYRLGTFVALALASLGGAPLDPEPDPESVADAWEAAAFLESVKCSPERGVGAPTGAMWRNCPDRYLVDELALLAPSVVIAVGKAPCEVLRRLLSAEIDEATPGFSRSQGACGGRDVEVLGCNHPSFGHWRATLPSLHESLWARPLGG